MDPTRAARLRERPGLICCIMHPVIRSSWIRYLAAVIAVGSALALKLLLVPLITQDAPYLLFFIAVMTAAWIGGLGPGLLATVLAALSNNYFFVQPYGQFSLATPDQRLRLALFAIEGVLVSVICASLQAAKQHVEQAAEEARELERRMLEISDAEQRRIGHDLHDGLGQQLTGIMLITKRLEKRLIAEKSPQAAEATQVCELAKTAVEWTHDLCRSLSPPVLEREGLAAALRELASNAERIFDISCVFQHDGELSFRDVPAGVHLYRIAQEAISNSVKHGKAKTIAIHLRSDGSKVAMSVVDDGTGFEPPPQAADGMGLRIMRYRAKMIGATVDVEQRKAGGTTVTCRYHPASAAHGTDSNHDHV